MCKNKFILLFLGVVFVLSLLVPQGQALAQRKDKVYGTNLDNDPRQGTVHIWTDPTTGDRMTVVRPGKKDADNSNYGPQNMPIIVYPEITPPTPHPRPPHGGQGGHGTKPGYSGQPVYPTHPGIPVGPNGKPGHVVPPVYGPLPNTPVTPNHPGYLVKPIPGTPSPRSSWGGRELLGIAMSEVA